MDSELLFGAEPDTLDYGNQAEGPLGDGIDGVDPTIADPTVTAPLKRRRPQVKLTSERLLGEKGLPYLMRNGPKRVRISSSRRNAHDNLSHIIQFYQLWAHDVYPKAKFNDFIRLCHSLGKSDKLLREYRTNLYREEINPGDGAQNNADDEDDELYTVSARPTANRSQEPQEQASQGLETQELETQELETQELEMQRQETWQEALDTQETFEEDPDAIAAMEEMESMQ